MHMDNSPGQPLISVVIPCYNYGQFIEETVDTVLQSTLQDLEIIIVNDGSDDPATLQVLQHLGGKGIRIIHQPNQGIPRALNHGISEARGKYIYRLDADDRIHPTLLEKEAAVLEAEPGIGFVTCYLQCFGTEDWSWTPPPFSKKLLLENNIVIGNSMFRKAAFEQANGFDEELSGYEDWEFWIHLASLGWEGFLIPEFLFFYRRHGANTSLEFGMRDEQLRRDIRAKHQALYKAFDEGLL